MTATTTSSYIGELLGEKERRSPAIVRRLSPAALSRGSDSSLDFACTRSSIDSSSSSSSSTSSLSPSCKQCVSATMDEYVAASTEGRQAFSHGNLKVAVTDFNHALAIELQTELDCLYDTNIGFMSGLVRSEVDSRLLQVHKSSRSSVKCSRILGQLRETFYKAAEGVERKHTESKWYLQMGAALVMINEWEKAKIVYAEGISICKDRKALKQALKNLIKIDQMTSYADIPLEDQPDNYPVSYSPPSSSPFPSPTSSPLQSPRPSPRPSPQPSLSPAPLPTTAPPKDTPNAAPRRDRSKSMGLKLRRHMRDRTISFSQEHKETKEEDIRRKSEAAVPQMVRSHLHKRSSFGLFGSKRVTLLSPDTTTAWSNCFQPMSCKVTSQAEFQPSAIKHMRTLSSLDDAEDDVGDVSKNNLSEALVNSGRFSAVTFTSMRIEDDDSELDDSD